MNPKIFSIEREKETEKNKIKAPYIKINKWRNENVACWSDPYLQAYIERKNQYDMVFTIVLAVWSLFMGFLLGLGGRL